MDNTELHYVTYDPDSIWSEMMTAYFAAGGEPLYAGDEKEILLRSVQASIVQVFAGVDNALRMQTLRYAVGEYLDLFGEKNGCSRVQAAPARATVHIEIGATIDHAPGIIPAGTSLTADGVNFYTLTEDVAKSGWKGWAEVEIVATRSGASGNALKNGTFMYLSPSDDNVRSVITITDATGGFDREDDERYRERIRRSFGASVTTGTAAQYENIALSCSPEIIDVKAARGSYLDGAGYDSVELCLLLPSMTEEEEESIIAAVTSAVSDEDIKPLSDIFWVSTARKLTYTIKIKYVAGTATLDSVQKAVNQYYAWQNTKIGRAFNPDRLISLLYSVGCERVTIDHSNSQFNNGAVEYTAIDSLEVCDGTVYLEAVNDSI